MVHAFVYAPPGAGKTTLINRLPLSEDHIQDADDIIAVTVGWPDGQWWRDEAASDMFSRKANKALLEYMRQYEDDGDDLIILLAGFPSNDNIITTSEFDIYHVDLNYSVNLSQLRKRERLDPDRPKISMHELANARRKIRTYGKKLNDLNEVLALNKEWFV